MILYPVFSLYTPHCAITTTTTTTTADKYSKVGAIANFTALTASDFPKVYILPLGRQFAEDLLSCSDPWNAKEGDAQYYAHLSPELPFGPVQEHFNDPSFHKR